MHYLVLGQESINDIFSGDLSVVQRIFTSNSELTKQQLERKFLVAHWKEYAEEAYSESTDNWTADDYEEFFNENNGFVVVDHFYQSNTPIHLEEVAK
jgi:hypothetical protein